MVRFRSPALNSPRNKYMDELSRAPNHKHEAPGRRRGAAYFVLLGAAVGLVALVPILYLGITARADVVARITEEARVDQNSPGSNQATASSFSPPPPRPTARMTPTRLYEATIVALETGDLIWSDPGNAIDALEGLLGVLDHPADKKRALDLLAEAELYQGHAQLAAAYFAQSYAAEPTLDSLFNLGWAYYIGGDRVHALETFKKCTDWKGEDPQGYRAMAEELIAQLEFVLLTSTP
jgi:hypothetical protein